MTVLPENAVERIQQLLKQAWRYYDTNEPERGKEEAQLAFDSACAYSLSTQKAQSLVVLAEYDREKGHYWRVHERIQEMRELYVHAARDRWFARGVAIQAFAYEHVGDYVSSLETWQELYDIYNDLDIPAGRAMALRRIGVLHIHQADLDGAKRYHEQSLALCQEQDFQIGIATIYTNYIHLYSQLKAYDDALRYGQQAIDLHTELGSVAIMAITQANMASLYSTLKQTDKALAHIGKAFTFAEQANQHYVSILVRRVKCNVLLMLGQPEKGFVYANEAMKMAEGADDLNEVVQIHAILSDLHEATGNLREALAYRKQQINVESKLRDIRTRTRYATLEVMYRTQQAKAEAQQQQALREQDRAYFEKLTAMKNDVMSMASHDLKNPLASMGIVTHLLRVHGRTDDAKGQQLLERIEANITRMRDLITNLLDLARVETGKALAIQDEHIVPFITEVVEHFEIMASDKSIHLQTSLPDDGAMAPFDYQALWQVMANLLSNAIKFTKAEGQVTLHVEQDTTHCIISVTDTGKGIAPDDLPYIFDRFYRADKGTGTDAIEGSGLGLAICQSIVQQHGGTITVESTAGVGSTFVVRLPLNP